jgi:lysophospholipase L1-like esterase
MMRARQVAPLVLATLLAASAPGLVRPSQASTPGIYIALGDSVAAGIGSSLPRTRSYPAIVHEWLERQTAATAPFSNLAVPGETSASFVAAGQFDRLREQLDRARAGGLPVAAVTLTLGGNEMLDVRAGATSDRQATLDAFRSDYAAALGAVRDALGPDTPLVVTTYYDPTDGDNTLQFTDSWWIAQFNAAIRDAARAAGATVADIHAAFLGHAARYTHFPLDVHPTNDGHETYARLVWSALGRDTTPPAITRLSRTMVTRATPTLRVQISDATALQDIDVTVEPGVAGEPFAVGNDEYALLLDFAGVEDDVAAARVTATDVAGNVAELAIDLTLAFGVPADPGDVP